MLLADHRPKIFRVGIAGIDECLPAIRPDEFEAFVNVAIAGDDVVAGMKLVENPAIESWQQPGAKRFCRKWPQDFRGEKRFETDPGVEPRPVRWHSRDTPAGPERDETQFVDSLEGAGIVVADRASRSSHHKFMRAWIHKSADSPAII